MKTAATILVALATCHQATAVVDKWTPENYDWSSHVGIYGCAKQNVTTTPPTKELVLFAADRHNITETDLLVHQNFVVPITVAATLRAVSFLSTAIGLASTAIGCYEFTKTELAGEQTTPETKSSCVLGIASSVLSFGVAGAAKWLANQSAAIAAARALAPPPQLPPIELGSNFREAMELASFKHKRDSWTDHLTSRGLSPAEAHLQYFHNDLTADLIHSAGLGDPEFLGYAEDSHQLHKRDGVHALAPRFAFQHPRHGPMVLSTMFANASTHVTVEPWIIGNPRVAKRWQEQYQAEVLDNKRLVEGRFDHSATQADPGNIEVDAAEMFPVAEDTLHCALGGDGWPLDQVLDVQFYDDANRATFGYASVGVFGDAGPEGDLGNLEPQPPVTGGEDC